MHLVGLEKAEDGGGPALDLALVTSSVHDPFFWSYMRMMLSFQGLIDRLRAWCESCPCHGEFLRRRMIERGVCVNRENASVAFQRMAGSDKRRNGHRNCPIATKQAPELVAGALHEVLRQIASAVESDLLATGEQYLTSEDRGRLIEDWNIARGFAQATLELKLGFVRVLPWCLAGVFHHDESLGRSVAATCVAQWEGCPDPRQHHREVVRLFAPETGILGELKNSTRVLYRCLPAPRSCERPCP